MGYISYTVRENHFKHTVKWELMYTNLNEEDVRLVAVKYNKMRAVRLEKLINHTSKKFNCMTTTKVSVEKIFHDEPVIYQSAHEQLMARVKLMTDELKKEGKL